MPVTLPEPSTETLNVLVHDPPGVASVIDTVAFSQTADGPVIPAGEA